MHYRIRLLILGLLFCPAVTALSAQDDKASRSVSHAPLAVGIVIDSSELMFSHLTQAVNLGRDIVHGAGPKDEFFVVRFITADEIEVYSDFTTNRETLNSAISDMFSENGRSAITDAVYVSAEKFPDRSQKQGQGPKRAIILITQGVDEGSYYKSKELLALLRQKHAAVYAVGISQAIATEDKKLQEQAKQYLKTLAKESGGRAYFPVTAAEMKAVTDTILSDIRGR